MSRGNLEVALCSCALSRSVVDPFDGDRGRHCRPSHQVSRCGMVHEVHGPCARDLTSRCCATQGQLHYCIGGWIAAGICLLAAFIFICWVRAACVRCAVLYCGATTENTDHWRRHCIPKSTLSSKWTGKGHVWFLSCRPSHCAAAPAAAGCGGGHSLTAKTPPTKLTPQHIRRAGAPAHHLRKGSS